MQGNSKRVESNQEGLHPDLEWAVLRHRDHAYLRPIAEHTRSAFAQASAWVLAHKRPVILDSGCGVGASTWIIAEKYPQCSVIGIDKSEFRLEKNGERPGVPLLPNMLLVRADLIDFWLLAHEQGWQLERHYLLYPNPWPKARHFMRRFHAHPIFPTLLALDGVFELRTNWSVYAAEFAQAYALLKGSAGLLEPWSPADPWTPFERKYLASGHSLFRFRSAS